MCENFVVEVFFCHFYFPYPIMQQFLIAAGVVFFIIGVAAYFVFSDFSAGPKVVMQPPTPPLPPPKEFTQKGM